MCFCSCQGSDRTHCLCCDVKARLAHQRHVRAAFLEGIQTCHQFRLLQAKTGRHLLIVENGGLALKSVMLPEALSRLGSSRSQQPCACLALCSSLGLAHELFGRCKWRACHHGRAATSLRPCPNLRQALSSKTLSTSTGVFRARQAPPKASHSGTLGLLSSDTLARLPAEDLNKVSYLTRGDKPVPTHKVKLKRRQL